MPPLTLPCMLAGEEYSWDPSSRAPPSVGRQCCRWRPCRVKSAYICTRTRLPACAQGCGWKGEGLRVVAWRYDYSSGSAGMRRRTLSPNMLRRGASRAALRRARRDPFAAFLGLRHSCSFKRNATASSCSRMNLCVGGCQSQGIMGRARVCACVCRVAGYYTIYAIGNAHTHESG